MVMSLAPCVTVRFSASLALCVTRGVVIWLLFLTICIGTNCAEETVGTIDKSKKYNYNVLESDEESGGRE